MSQERCIFCSILNEQTNIIYENSTLFVIADKFPLSHGHLLVIPKKHAPYLHELADEDTKDILCVIKKLVNALQLKKYNILQNNEHIQSVKHVHFHIIPCHDDDNQLKIDWKTQSVSDDYSDKMFKEVRKALGN